MRKSLTLFALLAATLFSVSTAIITHAAAPADKVPFTLDRNYYQLIEPQPVTTGDKIEVMELFWYGCPHCYSLEPYLEKWLKSKPENAEFVRVPAIWSRKTWEFHARVYYTFEALGVLDKLHHEFFDELHKRKNRIRSLETLFPFLEKQGVDKKQFMDAYDSFAVDSKVRHSKLVSEKSGADAVPTIVVDGKYRATASSAGGHEQLTLLIDYLVALAAKERKK